MFIYLYLCAHSFGGYRQITDEDPQPLSSCLHSSWVSCFDACWAHAFCNVLSSRYAVYEAYSSLPPLFLFLSQVDPTEQLHTYLQQPYICLEHPNFKFYRITAGCALPLPNPPPYPPMPSNTEVRATPPNHQTSPRNHHSRGPTPCLLPPLNTNHCHPSPCQCEAGLSSSLGTKNPPHFPKRSRMRRSWTHNPP